MAYGILSKPGTSNGPCETACQHTDCKQTRDMSERICAYCETPIGYERQICYSFTGELVHHACEIKLADAVRATFAR
jgi:hypothetical protein